MSHPGLNVEALAIPSIVVGGVTAFNMSVTDVQGHTQDVTAPHSQGNHEKPEIGIETRQEIATRIPLSPTPSDETRAFTGSLPTPINVNSLERVLTDHPDRLFVSRLCNSLKYRADIGYKGARVPRFSRNLPTALDQPDEVTANLMKEVALGRVAGPFPTPPFPNFQVSPIGLVPKKHSNKFRTIFHLSFPKSGVTRVNHSILKEDFSLQYITIDNAIEGILCLGQGSYLAKTDIEAAFHLIPLRPSDYKLFGMYWQGFYYYENVLPFGLRRAPFLFNQLSEAIEWILYNKCSISFVCHILDDFLIIEPASDSPSRSQGCQQSLSSMLHTLRKLCIPTAADKTQGPCTCLEFMGIILDSVRMEARLLNDKVERIQTTLPSFKSRKSCTLRELQTLIGTLNFACRVVPPGWPFLQRMIELTRRVFQPHHHIKLSSGFFKDLRLEWC